LDDWNTKRRAAAALYRKKLNKSKVVHPFEKLDVYHVYHLFVIQHEQRDQLNDSLREKGISCGIHYPLPLHHQEPYRYAKTIPPGLPIATDLSKKILSLPIFPEITEAQIETIAQAIEDFSL
jgi:dTDP-4-amino-4,6-dideoxygalactose transaminase